MIVDWRDGWLKDFFVHDIYAKKIPSEIRDRLFRKLQMIDDAACDADLRVPLSNHFERLSGSLQGWHSVRERPVAADLSVERQRGVKHLSGRSFVSMRLEVDMITTKRKPVAVGTILVEEFMQPMGLTQTELANRSGLPRKHVNELCRDRRAITADTALILSRVFGNSADFWLNTQRRTDLWEALNTPRRAERIARALPIKGRHAQAA